MRARIVLVLIARPLPEQTSHGSSTTMPRPRQVLHGSDSAKPPRFRLSWPDPSHVGQTRGTVPRVCPTCDGTGQDSKNLGGFALSEPCRTCRGRGMVVDDPCEVCSGSGRAMSTRTILARIPAGVADGQRIKLKGKGVPGERGGPAGDLYVKVHVTPHPVFGRSGNNLTVTVPVSFPEAALGAEIKVPAHRSAPVTVRIPPGTPNGRTFRVKGKGIRRRDGLNGDMLVTVEVVVPARLDSKARSALEAFREATAGEDPRGDLLHQARI
jgi:molecular chaperone DnaJ